MGEDRWLCTLMVQSGWRLEYCAAASNSTYCPEEFDEFFRQRRRWIPSTLANQILLLQEWKTLTYFNKQISFLFMIYQALLLFSTLVNPSVSILVIVGGLQFAASLDPVATTVLMICISVGYTAVCFFTSQDTQLTVAKVFTCLFAMVMAAVVIGTIVQIVEDEIPDITTIAPTLHPHNHTTRSMFWNNHDYISANEKKRHCVSSLQLPLSMTTLYLVGLTGLFLLTALMHLTEAYCLIHGIWYLFCLPAGNLFLMIYSICNITDRSWGTREEKKIFDFPKYDSWTKYFTELFKKVFFCCKYGTNDVIVVKNTKATQTNEEEKEEKEEEEEEEERELTTSSFKSQTSSRSLKTKNDPDFRFKFGNIQYSRPTSVADWLPPNLKDLYSDKFLINGYDDTSFIAGMTDTELKDIGITIKGHRNALHEAIKILPEPEIEPCVPNQVDEWLHRVGLYMYVNKFHQCHIITSTNMEILKTMTRNDINTELGITKKGHLRRLQLAISRLRYPTQMEKLISEMKHELEALHLHALETVNPAEYEFWEKLRQEKLLPDSIAFAYDADLKRKLEELRNSTLLVFAIANSIWLILILTLASKSELLNVLCTNPLGLFFLIIFGFLLVIQFICMIIHRFSTSMHMLARAPSKCGDPYNTSWAFKDTDFARNSLEGVEDDDDDVAARLEQQRMTSQLLERYQRRVFSRHFSDETSTTDETQPLLMHVRRQ